MAGIELHGLARSGQQHPLYSTWKAMVARCHSPGNKDYPYYGARGITVCDRWRFGENGKSGPHCFIEDMGVRPKGRTLDRRDNGGEYSKANCRWATKLEQNSNRRASALTLSAHCRNGHPKTEANTYVYRGAKNCRECIRNNSAKFKARRSQQEFSNA